jgi:hypothetical protein
MAAKNRNDRKNNAISEGDSVYEALAILSRISDSVIRENTPGRNFVKEIVSKAACVPNFDAESTKLANQAASLSGVVCSVVTEENSKCILYTLTKASTPVLMEEVYSWSVSTMSGDDYHLMEAFACAVDAAISIKRNIALKKGNKYLTHNEIQALWALLNSVDTKVPNVYGTAKIITQIARHVLGNEAFIGTEHDFNINHNSYNVSWEWVSNGGIVEFNDIVYEVGPKFMDGLESYWGDWATEAAPWDMVELLNEVKDSGVMTAGPAFFDYSTLYSKAPGFCEGPSDPTLMQINNPYNVDVDIADGFVMEFEGDKYAIVLSNSHDDADKYEWKMITSDRFLRGIGALT